MSEDEHQQDLAAQIKEYHQIGEYDKALEISAGALESNPVDLDAYRSRWELVADMFPEEEAKGMIRPEIESLLQTNDETQELLNTAYWGYRGLAGGADNVPTVLLDKMLQYPGTKVYQSALFGLAHQSPEAHQKWHYYQRLINECTASDVPGLSWYLLGHEHLLWLAEDDRSLASDDQLDELIDRLLKAHLSHCQDTQHAFNPAYTQAVECRLKFNIRLDKALENLECAEIRMGEKEEQERFVQYYKKSVEEAYKEISRLRGEVFLRQKRWKEAHDGLTANAPDFLESISSRFNESAVNYFWMMGRSAEGLGEWDTARRRYADAHFAPTPHAESRAGLERVYHQMDQGNADTFESFLKEAETEYRIREDADREEIRQKILKNTLNKKATDFSLETLDGEVFTLSAMRGKVLLLDVGASWCGPCNDAIPQIKTIYDQFNKVDNVAIWGINDGETPEQVQRFMEEHQPPWPILLDRRKQVRKAYQIRGIPFFVLIDKAGNWQYSFMGCNLIGGQPLIWMIEELLKD